jgi:UDP-glucose 4-epimerase
MGRGGLTPEFAPERSVNPVPRRLASTAKAEELLGFRSTIPLEQGLDQLVAWWRNELSSSAKPRQKEAAVS